MQSASHGSSRREVHDLQDAKALLDDLTPKVAISISAAVAATRGRCPNMAFDGGAGLTDLVDAKALLHELT
jgi:hypothetical protein